MFLLVGDEYIIYGRSTGNFFYFFAGGKAAGGMGESDELIAAFHADSL